MSKKSLKYIVIVVCIILIFTVLVFVLYPDNNNKDSYGVAETTVMGFLDSYKMMDGNANSYLSNALFNDTQFTYEGYQKYCAERIEYKITGVKTYEDEHVVSVEINNIDLYSVLNMLNEQNLNEEDMLKRFYQILDEEDVPMKLYCCDIVCKDYPTGMKILLDAQLSNALTGGFSSIV